MEEQLNNSTFNLTEEDLENFYNQNCRACGSQRCPGCYDEEWRDGCTLLKKYKGYIDKSKIKEHTMFNGNIHTITVEALLSNDALLKKVLDLIGRVYDMEHKNSFYKEIFDSKDILITYMELDEKVIGLGCICESHISYGIYELFWGMIDKDYRGNGWGKVLVDERINFVTKNMSGKSKPTDFFVVTESRWHLDRCGFHTLMHLNEKEYLMHKSAVEENYEFTKNDKIKRGLGGEYGIIEHFHETKE